MRTRCACVLVASVLSTLACSVDSRELLGIAGGGSSGSDLGGSTSFGSASGASAGAGVGDNASTAGSGGSGDAPSGGGDTVGTGGSGTSGGTSSSGGGVAGGGASSGGAGGGVLTDGCPDLDGNSVPDCQESLVQNPSFDADVAGWVKEPSANETWQSQDADKRAASGSLSVQNINVVDIDGSFMAGAKQCLPVTGGKNYVFYAKSFVATGQPGPPQGGFNVQFYNSTDCSGDPLTGRTSNLPDVADSWSVLQMSAQAFSNAHSMFVRLVVLKPFNAQPASVLFDDVLVRAE